MSSGDRAIRNVLRRGAPGRNSRCRSNCPRFLSILLGAALGVVSAGCQSGGKLPDQSSKTYSEVVSAFYVGLAALQVGDDVHADSNLAQVTQLASGEPAGWANWGILALRQRKLEMAAQRFEQARNLAPKNDQIY